MKGFSLCGMLLVLILFVNVPGCLSRQLPAILFDGEKYKFGEVTAGEDVVFTFYFTNPGSRDLILNDVYVSCDCVIIRSYDRVVSPGAKGKIYGVLKTKDLTGEIGRAIRVDTNIAGAKPVILNLEGIVLRPGISSSGQ